MKVIITRDSGVTELVDTAICTIIDEADSKVLSVTVEEWRFGMCHYVDREIDLTGCIALQVIPA